jgi:hypothetical protein
VQTSSIFHHPTSTFQVATGTWLTRDPIGQAGGVNVYG